MFTQIQAEAVEKGLNAADSCVCVCVYLCVCSGVFLHTFRQRQWKRDSTPLTCVCMCVCVYICGCASVCLHKFMKRQWNRGVTPTFQ